MRQTKPAERTAVAERGAVGQADRFTQLHDPLGQQRGGLSRGIMRAKKLRYGAFGRGGGDVVGAGEKPGHHAKNVSVHRRLRQAEGNGRDGARGIVPDAGELSQLGRRGRQRAAVVLHEEHGGFFEIAGAAVIAETLPELQQAVFGNGGQRRNIRKLAEKALVIGDHRLDARLLQHDFGDPGMVGGGILSPGQEPAAGGIPFRNQRDGVGKTLRVFDHVSITVGDYSAERIICHARKERETDP